MAKVLVTETYLENAGDAIRAKLGTNTTYLPSEFASAINGITTGVELSSSDEGKVVVEDDGDYVLAAQTSLSVTDNGTYDTTTNDEVVVSVSGGSAEGVPDRITKTSLVDGQRAVRFSWNSSSSNVTVQLGFYDANDGFIADADSPAETALGSYGNQLLAGGLVRRRYESGGGTYSTNGFWAADDIIYNGNACSAGTWLFSFSSVQSSTKYVYEAVVDFGTIVYIGTGQPQMNSSNGNYYVECDVQLDQTYDWVPVQTKAYKMVGGAWTDLNVSGPSGSPSSSS